MPKVRIAVVDYDAGNTQNVCNALQKQTVDVVLTDDPATIRAADGVILPGVGAFSAAMATLHAKELVTVLQDVAASGTPLLGICLGMQLLFDTSHEYGNTAGLGLIPGTVVPIPETTGLTIPHMGWNQNQLTQPDPLAADLAGDYLYFVHSYYVVTAPQYIVATTTHGVPLPSIVRRGRIWGSQGHPEKSSTAGQRLLAHFVDVIRNYKEHL